MSKISRKERFYQARVDIDWATYKVVKAAADAQDRSINSWMRQAVQSFLEREGEVGQKSENQ